MAVYKRSYRSYEGGLTPRWSRFLILTRYAASGIFQSRIITGLFVISFFFPLVLIAGLYLNHNARVLSMLKIGGSQLIDVNGMFFFVLMTTQGAFAFLMTAFIGPGMIAPDLANNALPLYFCRPLSRTEYVLGRACVIFFILSFMTWIPGLVIFGIETSLSGAGWAWDHRNFCLWHPDRLVVLAGRADALRARHLRLGALETGCGRPAAGRHVGDQRIRSRHQRDSAHQGRLLSGSREPDRLHLGHLLRRAHPHGHLTAERLRGPRHHLRILRTAAVAKDPGV